MKLGWQKCQNFMCCKWLELAVMFRVLHASQAGLFSHWKIVSKHSA